MIGPFSSSQSQSGTGRGPLFCPGCRTPAAAGVREGLCPACGDRLIRQGYCPVCEDFWLLAAGTSCPKHDLPLDEQGPPLLLERLEAPVHWVTVCHCSSSLAAQAPRIRLEAEGIPTLLDEGYMGAPSLYHAHGRGVPLKVPERYTGEARIILAQTWTALAAELDLEPEDEDEVEDEVNGSGDDAPQAAEPDRADLADEGDALRRSLLFLIAIGLPALLALFLLLRHWAER